MSVEIKELRIGNWLNNSIYNTPSYKILDKNLLSDFINMPDAVALNHYDYIELTPTILERFGFEDTKYGGGGLEFAIQGYEFKNLRLIDNQYQLIDNFEQSDWFVDAKGNDYEQTIDIEIYIGNPIKFLHSLQNIFHSLTGIELNDVFAYNYYLKLHKKLTGFDGSISFENFISTIENPDKTKFGLKGTSICEKMPEYNLGDLPPNLFL